MKLGNEGLQKNTEGRRDLDELMERGRELHSRAVLEMLYKIFMSGRQRKKSSELESEREEAQSLAHPGIAGGASTH